MKYRGILFISILSAGLALLSGVSVDAGAQAFAPPPAAPTANEQRKANRALSRKVYAALAQHKEIDAGNISVVARDGTLTLSGTVQEARQIDAVAAIAQSVPGVRAVTNRLAVQRPMGE